MEAEYIVTATFLNLGAGMWWQYKELSNRGTVRVDCTALPPDLIQLKQSGGTNPAEHLLQGKPIDVMGTEFLQYTWLQSKVSGQTVHWGAGLILPSPWQVGVSVSAISTELNPATGNAVRFAMKLAKSTTFKPPKGSPIQGPLPAIAVSQTITDTKLGTKLAEGTTIFVLGVGSVEVKGQNFGVFYNLQLENWSGAHKG
jgi:hypothetical protein